MQEPLKGEEVFALYAWLEPACSVRSGNNGHANVAYNLGFSATADVYSSGGGGPSCGEDARWRTQLESVVEFLMRSTMEPGVQWNGVQWFAMRQLSSGGRLVRWNECGGGPEVIL